MLGVCSICIRFGWQASTKQRDNVGPTAIRCYVVSPSANTGRRPDVDMAFYVDCADSKAWDYLATNQWPVLLTQQAQVAMATSNQRYCNDVDVTLHKSNDVARTLIWRRNYSMCLLGIFFDQAVLASTTQSMLWADIRKKSALYVGEGVGAITHWNCSIYIYVHRRVVVMMGTLGSYHLYWALPIQVF